MKFSLARGRVLLAMDRLAADLPLHGGIISQWRLVEDESINTMAIGFARGRLILSYNPRFVESLTIDEISAVLNHEANHVLFLHCERESDPNENHRAMVISEETVVNEWIVGKLPGEPVLLSDYPTLPANEDTQTRYNRLLSIVPEEKDALDDHSRWSQICGQLGSAVVAKVIADTWLKMSPEQKAKANLPKSVQKIVEEAVRSSGTSTISGGGVATISWQQVLKRYIGRTMTRCPLFSKPPRRFPEMVGILPGRGRSGTKPHIAFCLDTSGSMNESVLSAISAELVSIARTHQVTVIEADNVVRAVYRFTGTIETVNGRGGTNFSPAIMEAAKLKPDLIIYATDGYGKCQVDPPRCPFIWLLTRGHKPVSWGREIHIL